MDALMAGVNRAVARAAGSAALVLVLLAVGCVEPLSVGRFRRAPVTSVILPNLGVVDEEPEVFAGAREPEPRDLIPERREYAIGPGDEILISVFELLNVRVDWRSILVVSETGRVTMPEIGTFRAAGQTELELAEKIKGKLSPGIIKDPTVSVVVTSSRERVYSISGAVSRPDRYAIGEVDFRLTEAFAQAGGIPQANVDYAYVVRTLSPQEIRQQIEATYWKERELLGTDELLDEADDDALPPMPMPPTDWQGQAPPAESLPVKLEPFDAEGGAPDETEELLVPEDVMEEVIPDAPLVESPEEIAPEDDEEELLDSVAPMMLGAGKVKMVPRRRGANSDLLESRSLAAVKTANTSVEMMTGNDDVLYAVGELKPLKVIRDGGTFRVGPGGAGPDWQPPVPPSNGGAQPDAAGPDGKGPEQEPKPWEGLSDEDLASRMQQVIRIDVRKLRGGDARMNIIIKAGDEIRVPLNSVGEFYVMGQVVEPGSYSLTGRRLTLKHAIAAAGPLTQLAYPQRCDIIRRIGDDREVFFRVNLRKVMEGTAHDIFLKPNDIINVGSHPVMRWVATIRNSFRSSYGFGFVYDRNFGDKDAGN